MNGTMKTNTNSIIGLVVASLLVVAIVAIAIPNAVDAKLTHEWCQTGPFGQCFDNKGDCQKAEIKGETRTCIKTSK